MSGKGVKYYGSNIVWFGYTVTISTLLSLYRQSINGGDIVYVHEQCNIIDWEEIACASRRI